jgi:hypothetical protein
MIAFNTLDTSMMGIARGLWMLEELGQRLRITKGLCGVQTKRPKTFSPHLRGHGAYAV